MIRWRKTCGRCCGDLVGEWHRDGYRCRVCDRFVAGMYVMHQLRRRRFGRLRARLFGL